MLDFSMDRVQFFSLVFSVSLFAFVLRLLKKRRVNEEYTLLWLLMSIFLLYLSVDRHAVDRIGSIVGIAYKPSVIILIMFGFFILVLIHLSIILTRQDDRIRRLIQEQGLSGARLGRKSSDILAVIPAFNEERTIPAVVSDLATLSPRPDILIVNDGSTDRTAGTALNIPDVHVINLPSNIGIGGAVQTGFRFAVDNGYRQVFQFDGDGQHIASEVPPLLSLITDGKADMAIGSRFLGNSEGYRSTFLRRIGIQLFRILNSMLINQPITDNTSGFRAYSEKAVTFLAKEYPPDYPEPEAVILLKRNGFKIAEIPSVMKERSDGVSSIRGLTGLYYMAKVILAITIASLRKGTRGNA